MKASTLIVIAIALLVGLAAMAGANAIGLFKPKTPLADQRVKDEPILVLVANTDLAEGIAITAADVRVRELRPTERQLYDEYKNRMMPPFIQAATLRVPKDRINADTPLLRDNFVEGQVPPMSKRLDPGMRAVNVTVTKDRSAGGVVRVNELVDVWLTTRVTDPLGRTSIRSAMLDRNCRVVMKRNTLYTLLMSDSDQISYTLQANPYRAALIEWAQQKGQVFLAPVPMKMATSLDPTALVESPMMKTMSFDDMSSPEYRNEDERVRRVNSGDYAISDEDLARIFKIVPPPSKVPPIQVVLISNVFPSAVQSFERDSQGNVAPMSTTTPINGGKSGGSATFQDLDPDKKDCPTCGKNKQPGAQGAPGASGAPGNAMPSGATFNK
jgi:Flp pilus assembly protein CpaB